MNKVENRDPYKAVWVSHSSMGDFLKCPRLYYLHNVYKNPQGRKIAVVSPHMSLGVAVHNTIENLANFKVDERIVRLENLQNDYEENWKKVSGKIGGFESEEQELEFKERGRLMIDRVMNNPGPILEKTVNFPPKKEGEKIDMLPHYYINEKDNIILCGKVDWLEYLPETDSLNVIDFKTGKNEEKEESLQLPIYQLLLHNLQKRKVTNAQYWYLDNSHKPVNAKLYDLKEAYQKVYVVAKKVEQCRVEEKYNCNMGEEGCTHCRPYERILNKIRGGTDEGIEYVGKGEYKQDLYVVLK